MIAPAPKKEPRYDTLGASATLVLKLWGLGSGPIQAALVVTLLSPETQGDWYAISSLQRFQTLVELGMGTTLAAAIARSDRPAAWLRMGQRWHWGMAVAWTLLAGPLGAFWLQQNVSTSAVVPWLTLVVASSLGMPPIPALLALEARGEVAAVSAFRTVQGMASRFFSWGLLFLGGGIWSQTLERLLAGLGAWAWLRALPRYFPGLTRRLPLDNPSENPLPYREAVFPLHWRIAAATVGGSLPFALLVPAAVEQAGKVEGGRLGALLTVLSGLQGLGWAIISPALPRTGQFLSAGEPKKALYHLRYATLSATGMLLLGMTMLLAVLQWAPVTVSQRLPPLLPSFLLCLAFLLRFLREAYAAWCRADLRPVTWAVDVLEVPCIALLLRQAPGNIPLIFAVSSLMNLLMSLAVGQRR